MTTPMMKQWHSVKDRHREGIVFFRMGDFFEFFHEDAKVASRLLGLTLTARSKGDRAIPMAGIPVRQVESYVARLVDLGQKVVICDQVEDPATATGIVDRDVTRIVTPGTVVDPGSLDDKDNNYLLALGPRKGSWGMAWVDLSTGEFAVREVEESRLDQTLQGFDAAEILLPEGRAEDHALVARCRAALGCPVTWRPDFRFDQEAASRALNRHFGTLRLSGFGIEEETFPLGAAGAVLDYLEETQRGAIGQVRSLRRVQDGRTMAMDRSTRASLELVRTLRDADRKGSLLGVMDRTVTAMGARLLKSWILEPLLDADAIRDRQGAVSELVDAPGSLQSLREALDQVLDVERLAGRVGSGRVNARDLAAIAQSIASLPRVIASLGDTSSPWLRDRIRDLPDLDDLQHRLASTLVDAPPMSITEGGIIAEGHDPELDEMRRLGREGKGFIASFQARESEATGIANLKIGFNRVFGYYIEISNGQRDKVPERYHRKQTLKNAERYITPELKDYEDKVLHAEENAKKLEYEIFLELRGATESRLDDLQTTASILAALDVVQSLARLARDDGYCRPTISDDDELIIEEGKHPVLVRIGTEEPFVPNDLQLDAQRRLMLITGPNMAGKSTYIRQVALITLMAQMGSWVPAKAARLGVVDQVFTRVGASDDLARGSSTFMVEMLEVANILNNATARSLVILDEVGRGTSTWDGLSLARAISEHLVRGAGTKTLFATHYHELTSMAEDHPGVVNYNVAVREHGDEIVFLHRILEGATDRSYGIQVARLAGLPRAVVDRARTILGRLESGDGPGRAIHAEEPLERQLSLFEAAVVPDPIRERIRQLDPDDLSPREAHRLLYELKKDAESAS